MDPRGVWILNFPAALMCLLGTLPQASSSWGQEAQQGASLSNSPGGDPIAPLADPEQNLIMGSDGDTTVMAITPKGPDKSTMVTISSEPSVIIKLKDEPLGPLRKRIKSPERRTKQVEQDNTGEQIKVHEEKIRSEHRQIKEFIKTHEPGHHGEFKEYRFALNGLATKVRHETLEKLRSHPLVESVHMDLKMQIALSDSVPLIGANTMWTTYGATGKGIVVAIVDTGIDYRHPDLGSGFGPSYKVIGGYDFFNNDADPMDGHGHGTHVAGIVAANGTKKGVAPDAKLMAYKVLSDGGWGYWSHVIAGINRAVDPDQDPTTDDAVDIMNLSLGGSGDPDDPVSQAIDNAVNAGVVCVVAAGNSGSGYWTVMSPGCARKALTVGATDKSDKIAWFSSRGPVTKSYAIKPDVTAPGVSITAPFLNGGYQTWSGTSMASPHVAGAAALLKELHPTWTADEIKGVLIQKAKNLNLDSFTQGGGRIQPVASHQAGAVMVPGSISFGLDDVSLNIWTKTEILKIKNLSSVTSTYSFTVSASFPAGVTYSVTPSAVTLASGETHEVSFTIAVDNTVVPDPTNGAASYEGKLLAQTSSEVLTIPFSFLKSAVLEINFASVSNWARPFFVQIHNRKAVNDKTFVYRWHLFPSSILTALVPADTYDVFVFYVSGGFETIVVREGIVVKTKTQVEINQTQARHAITFKQRDENQRELPWSDERGLATYSACRNGVGILHFGLGYSPSWQTSYYSDISSAYVYEAKVMFPTASHNGAYYDFLYGFNNGITQSQAVYNTPLKSVALQYKIPPGISQIEVWPYLVANSKTFLIGFTFNPMVFTLTSSFSKKAYLSSVPYSNFIYGQNLQRIYKYTSDWDWYNGRLYTTPLISAPTTDTLATHPWLSISSDPPIFSTTADEMPINSGPYVWFTRSTNKVSALKLQYIWPYTGYCTSPSGDAVPYPFMSWAYKLYNNADNVEISSGSSVPADLSINPGSYTLKVEYNKGYWVRGQEGKGVATLIMVDTRNPDRDPPYIKNFSILSDGILTDTTSPLKVNQLKFTVQDDKNLTAVAAYYDTGSGWQAFTLPAPNGNMATFTVDIPGSLVGGFVNLRIWAKDKTGNTLTYDMTPGFYHKNNLPPNVPATPSGPTSGKTDLSYSYSAQTTDPNGDPVLYTFDWGDGTTYTTTYNPSGIAATAAHAWKNVGSYAVRVKATDSDGLSSTWSDSLTMSITAPVAVSPPSGLVSWWPGDGNANDIIGGNHGTLRNGTAFAAGKVGHAFRLDGVDDFVEVPDSPSLHVQKAFTIEVWVMPERQALMRIFQRVTPDTVGINLLTDTAGTRYRFNIDNGPTDFDVFSTTPLSVGNFQHLACTFDGSTMRLYVNGKLEGTTSASPHPDISTSMRFSHNDIPFKGWIDELCLYNRALTPTEVWSIYESGTAGKIKSAAVLPPSAPLPGGAVSWWDGDQVIGTAAIDLKGANSATMANGVGWVAGKVGQAFQFDGVDDYLYRDNASFRADGPWTIEMWVYARDIASAPVIFSAGDAVSTFAPSLRLNLHTTGASFCRRDDSGVEMSSGYFGAIPVGEWFHLAYAYDGSQAMLYINGVLAGSRAWTTGRLSTEDIAIGALRRGRYCCEAFFNGMMDEISIYDRALPLTDIQAIYDAGSAGKIKVVSEPAAPAPVSWWDGDQVSGATAIDLKGANSAAMANGVGWVAGKVGQAFQFDGVDDYLYRDNASFRADGPWTIEMWVYARDIASAPVIFSAGDAESGYMPALRLNIHTTGASFWRRDENGSEMSSGYFGTVPVGGWFHLAYVYDGSQAMVYINGALAGSRPWTAGRLTTEDIAIGALRRARSCTEAFFSGMMDEITLYDRVLSATDIKSIFDAGSAGKAKTAQ